MKVSKIKQKNINVNNKKYLFMSSCDLYIYKTKTQCCHITILNLGVFFIFDKKKTKLGQPHIPNATYQV